MLALFIHQAHSLYYALSIICPLYSIPYAYYILCPLIHPLPTILVASYLSYDFTALARGCIFYEPVNANTRLLWYNSKPQNLIVAKRLVCSKLVKSLPNCSLSLCHCPCPSIHPCPYCTTVLCPLYTSFLSLFSLCTLLLCILPMLHHGYSIQITLCIIVMK